MGNLQDLVPERLETFLLARLSTYKGPPGAGPIANDVQRYAPSSIDAGQWRDRVTACLQGMIERGVIDDARRVVRVDELKDRTGAAAGMRWQNWSERFLPALSLGIRADDARSHARLKDRDAWAAAIVARAHGLWTDGPPPTLPKVCDALTWRALGLGSTPKQCPAEVRSHFLRTYIDSDAGTPKKLVRQLAARATSALRPDLRALHVALIAGWLAGRELAAREPSPHEPSPREASPREPSLIDAVRQAARDAREGLFGDRKVFISSIWQALRAEPPWSRLQLEDFKAQLISAHRSQKLELARADLVAAMDPALVAASETPTDGATFHFIVREPLQ